MRLTRFLSGRWAVGLVVCALAGSDAAASTLHVPSVEYPTIQAAINAAGAGDEIMVAAGTYNEKINFLGKAITLRSANGPEVTTIDGTGLNDSVVKCVSGEGPDTVLRGFAITGGTGKHTPFMVTIGGGMLIEGSSPSVLNCVFTKNRAYGDGGTGGGVYNWDGNPTIVNCLFLENKAIGAGIGGGMYTGGSPLIANCTFVANFADEAGGGIRSERSLPTITGCILWGNADYGGRDESAQLSGAADVTYTLIQGLDAFASGAGNIDGDPMFVSSDDGDFRLRAGSPCIDAGSNAAFMSAVSSIGLTIDLDGHTRFVDSPAAPDTGIGLGAVIDMGAYEFGSNPGDLDHDGDVDLHDFAAFLNGFRGP